MYEAVYHCEQVLLLMHAHDVVLVRANQSLCSPPSVNSAWTSMVRDKETEIDSSVSFSAK